MYIRVFAKSVFFIFVFAVVIYRHSNCFAVALVCPVLVCVSVCLFLCLCFQCLINALRLSVNIVYRVVSAVRQITTNNEKTIASAKVCSQFSNFQTWLRSSHVYRFSPAGSFHCLQISILQNRHRSCCPCPSFFTWITCWLRRAKSAAHVADAAAAAATLSLTRLPLSLLCKNYKYAEESALASPELALFLLFFAEQ